MAKRGGKRPGAGRKPKLTELQRLRVGGHCERLWREAAEKKLQSAIAERSAAVQETYERARWVPLKDRGHWISSDAGEEYLDDVDFALREEQQITADNSTPPSRLLTVHVARPKGVHDEIVAKVAQHYRISERLTQTCWDEFRRIEKRLREDDTP